MDKILLIDRHPVVITYANFGDDQLRGLVHRLLKHLTTTVVSVDSVNNFCLLLHLQQMKSTQFSKHH